MILFEIKNQVAIITLNRPEKYHAFIREMALDLQDKLDLCKSDNNIRAIILTASGKAFCAGQDLGEVTDKNKSNLTKMVQEHYNPIIRKIRAIEKPIIAAVNGVAAGAGASIALSCDIVVAKESAVFVQAFSKIGLIPDSGGTFFLPRLVGIQRAAALMMTADPISAIEAQNMGMIYRTFKDDEFIESSFDLAERLAQMPTKALGLTKRLLNKSLNNDLETQINEEEKHQTIAGKTNDFKEGLASFLEKRKPKFNGN
ncbi:MAG: 2-(1,2-epoxy-1,2-dihydrophenyl)acetyl-CoA isomerase [Flavobacteriales bacterium]|jgi:2-(1,2-epoxy-1,2-dihydrophenyl)acetyl-CoA isomerase|nr:2-(1,2-epoxy-1,2-dihydrophenyl)acetyl-CoA isomerase [Flavobacteriales bacterium]